MKPVKRIEIVTDAIGIREFCAMFEEQGVKDYTIIKDVTGKGKRGFQSGDELTDVFSNTYLLTTCDEKDLVTLLDYIRPLLIKLGGMCLISDAQWVSH
jgi:hypothetical protein